MNRKLAAIMMALSSLSATAGGLLTNTNQNVAFLRNPSRDAAIGIDGVYSNPAGVAFLNEGFHLSLNWQNAHQKRTVTSTFGTFKYGINNGGQMTKKFEGKADAPFVPSVQFAYNRNKWSFQFGFAITGGGGKATFDKGLGSFESVVSLIPALANSNGMNITGYDFESYLKGRQYYFGVQLGSAYKVTENLSVYGGLRVIYGSCNYYGYLRNISVEVDNKALNASEYFGSLCTQAIEGAAKCKDAAEKYVAAGMLEDAATYATMAETYATSAKKLGALSVATKDITLNCDQTGAGVAPVVGIDYKAGKWNFAVKYDFKTKMRLENKSANSESANNLSALEKFADGKTIAEDAPALLTAGIQFEPIERLRISAGYHLFFDKQAKQYADHQKLLDGNTFEYMAGAEFDINKHLQVSAGYQNTNYQFTDDYMSDISFNVSSYTLGGGFGIIINDKLKFNLAYFQTNYDTYRKQTSDYNNLSGLIGSLAGDAAAQAMVSAGQLAGKDEFTRTNRVIGLGVEINF
ncbi:MAG: outer membrane protein transport protein [Bacteroidales bacterium]|nr:outer membrane protein transport protein [Bacteroidales bacterium]